MTCPYCEKEARWCDNAERYGRRYGKSYMCYWCEDCDAYVGCHENTKRPLGTMANANLRRLRMAVHRKIDPLWKSGKIKRKYLYDRISDKIGKSFHTGESDEMQCLKVLELDLDTLFQK